jgi:hypothetical protein
MVLGVAEIRDQLTNMKEVSLLYSAPQRSQEPLVRTEISKMSHRQKQMVPPSAWTAIAAIRSYIPEPLAPAPAPAAKYFFRVGLVNSGWDVADQEKRATLTGCRRER